MTVDPLKSNTAPRDRPVGPQTQKGGVFHIPSLDGIRAVSFMVVFVSHAGLGHVVPGGFGVTVFFFLSGYLITTLLRLERQRTGANSLRDFYLRRVFRILPPFYSILAVAVALSALGLIPGTLDAAALLSQVGHFANYWVVFNGGDGVPAGTVVYWSLAVEEHFYLLFPCLFLWLQAAFPRHRGRQAAVLVGLCVAVLAWRCVLVMVFHTPDARTELATDTRFDSILFGCVLATVGNPMFDRWRGSKALWTGVLLPAGCALLLLSFLYREEWFRQTWRYSVQGLGLVPLFVTAIRYPDWGPMRLLSLPLVRRMGLLSYSLYLSHQVILAMLAMNVPQLPMPVAGALGLALAWGFSSAVLRFVEKPSAQARRKYVTTPWLRTPPEPDPAVATAGERSQVATSRAGP